MSIIKVFLLTLFCYRQHAFAITGSNFTECLSSRPVNIIECQSTLESQFSISARVCDGFEDCLDSSDESTTYCGTGCTSVYKGETKLINCGQKRIDVLSAINTEEKSQSSIDSGVDVTPCFTKCNGQTRCKVFFTEERFSYVLVNFQCLERPATYTNNEQTAPPCNAPITQPYILRTTVSEPNLPQTTANETMLTKDRDQTPVSAIVGGVIGSLVVICVIIVCLRFRRVLLSDKFNEEIEYTQHHSATNERYETSLENNQILEENIPVKTKNTVKYNPFAKAIYTNTSVNNHGFENHDKLSTDIDENDRKEQKDKVLETRYRSKEEHVIQGSNSNNNDSVQDHDFSSNAVSTIVNEGEVTDSDAYYLDEAEKDVTDSDAISLEEGGNYVTESDAI